MAGLGRNWKAIVAATALTLAGVAHLAIAQQFDQHVDKLRARELEKARSSFAPKQALHRGRQGSDEIAERAGRCISRLSDDP
jgi:hypothetical protein